MRNVRWFDCIYLQIRTDDIQRSTRDRYFYYYPEYMLREVFNDKTKHRVYS